MCKHASTWRSDSSSGCATHAGKTQASKKKFGQTRKFKYKSTHHHRYDSFPLRNIARNASCECPPSGTAAAGAGAAALSAPTPSRPGRRPCCGLRKTRGTSGLEGARGFFGAGAAGRSGQQCEQAQCPGHCGAPSNGRCLVLASGDAHCLCARGWTGAGCLQSTCEGGCSGHGRCDGGRCACDGGTLNGPYPFNYR